jgi:hypothetical protein
MARKTEAELRMKRVRPLAMTTLAVLGTLTTGMIPAGAITKSQVQAKALAISDMPTGWSVNNASLKSSSTSNCSGSNKAAKHDVRVEVSYQNGNVPDLAEAIEGGPSAGATYRAALARINKCTTLSVTNGGTTLSGGGGAMSFPATAGAKTDAYAFNLTYKGVSLGFDLVLFLAGKYSGLVTLADVGTPDTTLLQYFVSAAIEKAEGRPLPPAPSS